MPRDPRWGRIMEGAGEDAFLGSLIAAVSDQNGRLIKAMTFFPYLWPHFEWPHVKLLMLSIRFRCSLLQARVRGFQGSSLLAKALFRLSLQHDWLFTFSYNLSVRLCDCAILCFPLFFLVINVDWQDSVMACVKHFAAYGYENNLYIK